jgi:peptidoglycan/LPS O-acetylase OafA/YrhL
MSRANTVRSGVWLAIAALLVVLAAREALVWGVTRSVIATLLGAMLAGMAAVAIVRSWRVGRWLTASAGLIVVIYAGALMFLGSEDVGGPAVSLPAGLALGCFGVWNVVSAAWDEAA